MSFLGRRLVRYGLGVTSGTLALGTGALFWRANSFSSASSCTVCHQPVTSVDSLQLQTGDIVLFDRECSRFGVLGSVLCAFAKVTGKVPFDHIGMIQLVPEAATTTATATAAPKLIPHVLEADFRGVRLRPLHDRLSYTRSKSVVLRQLVVDRTPDMARSVDAFVDAIRHKPYEADWLSMARAAYDTPGERERLLLLCSIVTTQRDVQHQIQHIINSNNNSRDSATTPTASALFNGLLSGANVDTDLASYLQASEWWRLHTTPELRAAINTDPTVRATLDAHATARYRLRSVNASIDRHPLIRFSGGRNTEDLSSLFCSELVAACYQRMGVLPWSGTGGAQRQMVPASNDYTPADFMKPDRLPLLRGAHLTPPIRIK